MPVYNKICPCPYLPCKHHGNCVTCSASHWGKPALNHCLEDSARLLGATIDPREVKTILCNSPATAAQECAWLIADAIKEKPNALISLPAEESSKVVYQALLDMQKKNEVSFREARFVQMYEWLDVPEDESRASFLRKNFLNPAGIEVSHVHNFIVTALDDKEVCAEMDAFIEANGPIDLMLFELGQNGCIALCEPHVYWKSDATIVELSDITKDSIVQHSANRDAPVRGITLGMQQAFAAKQLVLHVTGKEKSETLKKVYETAPAMKLPGTIVQLHQMGMYVIDTDAASLLDTNFLERCLAPGNIRSFE